MKEERIVFRVNAEVKQLIKEKADQVHKTVSQFLRELALNYTEKIQPRQEAIYLKPPQNTSASPQPQNRAPEAPDEAMIAKRKTAALKTMIFLELEEALENGGNLTPIPPEELKRIKKEQEDRLQSLRRDKRRIASNSFYEL